MEIMWKVHPIKRNKFKTFLMLVIVIITIAAIHYFFKSFFFTSLSIIFLLVSLNSVYLPTYYKIENNILSIKKWKFNEKKIDLKKFKKVYPEPNGIFLSKSKHNTFLKNLRGIFLLYDASDKKRVDSFLKKIVEEKIE